MPTDLTWSHAGSAEHISQPTQQPQQLPSLRLCLDTHTQSWDLPSAEVCWRPICLLPWYRLGLGWQLVYRDNTMNCVHDGMCRRSSPLLMLLSPPRLRHQRKQQQLRSAVRQHQYHHSSHQKNRRKRHQVLKGRPVGVQRWRAALDDSSEAASGSESGRSQEQQHEQPGPSTAQLEAEEEEESEQEEEVLPDYSPATRKAKKASRFMTKEFWDLEVRDLLCETLADLRAAHFVATSPLAEAEAVTHDTPRIEMLCLPMQAEMSDDEGHSDDGEDDDDVEDGMLVQPPLRPTRHAPCLCLFNQVPKDGATLHGGAPASVHQHCPLPCRLLWPEVGVLLRRWI